MKHILISLLALCCLAFLFSAGPARAQGAPGDISAAPEGYNGEPLNTPESSPTTGPEPFGVSGEQPLPGEPGEAVPGEPSEVPGNQLPGSGPETMGQPNPVPPPSNAFGEEDTDSYAPGTETPGPADQTTPMP